MFSYQKRQETEQKQQLGRIFFTFLLNQERGRPLEENLHVLEILWPIGFLSETLFVDFPCTSQVKGLPPLLPYVALGMTGSR